MPGRQSVVFPTAPEGFLFPTDPGGPRTLAPISNLGFSPRVGLAWSPHAPEDSFLVKILGGAGTTSIRTGFGKFYSAIEALSISVLAANSPYGTTYTSPAPPLFSDPFITASNGQNFGQPFPYTFAPRNSSASHPDTSFDWSSVEPISGIPAYDIHNRIPYSDQWMLSLERQFGSNTVVNASYVGNIGRRLRVLVEANPGNPAPCLSLSQQNQVAPGSATCGSLWRKQHLHNCLWANCQRHARPAGPGLRKRRLSVHHRNLELQRAGTQRASYEREAAIFCFVYLQQSTGRIFEHWR